ncbi:MAG: PDZ domain-containing protein, partial [Oscillospiraceae bacterium]
MSVKISEVSQNSPAKKMGIQKDDVLVAIGGNEINDVLDYQFYAADVNLSIEILRQGIPYSIALKKHQYEDLGLEFTSYLMDKQRSCCNNCIFCFIDQNPPSMRESIYFKDDDDRLSFLFGNYITLTNLSQHDVERIIKMKISPINISVHTTNPEL